ncbi:3-hydroxyacyl-CoA dehydrogenase [Roseivivax lentus]|uniref:3-hydroxyacyl-CoA dehydrogenase n=1 Tax=Roseivivax lentus TaxID=633194 RepID=A0A1N7PL76_9RHOB|nr:enoyl-CoA hydratase-related protein [Roseivivax lentus]SIT11338.1 3-hydroxyacyl-CoA dehydrogenase [Roseivivax lentus]
MPDLVHRHVAGGIAVLEIANPPANLISAPVRSALSAALAETLEDPGIDVLLIVAAGRDFCTGLDLPQPRGFAARGEREAPTLSALCAEIEAATKPVVAAIQGQVFSSGAELALAAHYRLAGAGAQIAFPEVRVGLSPRGGSTQRLPRLLGADPALDLLLGGRPVTVRRPPARALFDAVVAEDLRGAALRFCAPLQEAGSGPRPSAAAQAGLRDPVGYQAAIARRRAQLAGHPEAARHAILDCVEAAQLLPFEAGLAREADACLELAGSDQALAMRQIFLAERRLLAGAAQDAAHLPEEVRIAVLGGGPLATEIVICALKHGIAVNWGTRDPSRLRAGMNEVTAALTAQKARGAVTEADLRVMLDRLKLGESHKMAEGIHAAIIAARGQGAVPLPPGAPRFKAFPDPVAQVDLRFAPPVTHANFAEVLVGPGADPEAVQFARALVRRMGKLPLVVATRGDAVTDRMMMTLQAAADALVDLGEDPFAIDAAVRGLDWPRAPFEMRDIAGLADGAGRPRPEGARNWSALVLQTGRQGLATGRGFYLHREEGRVPDPAVRKLIDDMRPPAPQPRDLDALAECLMTALANAGARLLADRAVARSDDIDLAMHLGLGFPRWRGGPMMAADRAGLFHVKRILDSVDHPDRRLWEPHPIWADLVKNGRRFADLGA